jgi:hypothetical protein
MGRSFPMRLENPRPRVTPAVARSRSPLLKNPDRRAEALICSPSPALVTFPKSEIFFNLERYVKQSLKAVLFAKEQSLPI